MINVSQTPSGTNGSFLIYASYGLKSSNNDIWYWLIIQILFLCSLNLVHQDCLYIKHLLSAFDNSKFYSSYFNVQPAWQTSLYIPFPFETSKTDHIYEPYCIFVMHFNNSLLCVLACTLIFIIWRFCVSSSFSKLLLKTVQDLHINQMD